MRYLIFIALWTLSCIEPLSAASRTITPDNHGIDPSMIDPFYAAGDIHTFRIADTQTVYGFSTGDYSVEWYVDTREWDFNPQTNHIFSKIIFKKGNMILDTFIDDEGWSYYGVVNSKAKMFKSFSINNDCIALLFRGGAYAAGIPKLTIFVICGNEVNVVFNKEYFIGNVTNDRVTFKKDYQGSELGYLTLSNGQISIVTNDYPSGKIIYSAGLDTSLYICPRCGYESDKHFGTCPVCHWHDVH